jgi:hypothetical protein
MTMWGCNKNTEAKEYSCGSRGFFVAKNPIFKDIPLIKNKTGMYWMCNLFVFSNLGKKTDLSNDDGDALPNKQKEKNFLLAGEVSVKQKKYIFKDIPIIKN